MREFFKGWRRKAGCITLVMALLLTSAWIRSYGTADSLRLEFRHSPRIALVYEVESAHGGVGFSRYWYVWTGDSFPSTFRFGPSVYSVDAAELDWWPDDPGQIDWFWYGLGFYVGGYSNFWDSDSKWTGRFIISYSLLVLPLTLLSVYLILWKPRNVSTNLPLPQSPIPNP